MISQLLTVLAAVAAQPASTPAQPAALEVRSAVWEEQLVKAEDGSTTRRLVAPTQVVPGDAVIYQISYRNTGQRPAERLVITNPLPEALRFVGNDDGPPPELSTDGKVWGPLSALSVPTTDGARRPAGVEDITHVRWTLTAPLAPGARGEVAVKAKLK